VPDFPHVIPQVYGQQGSAKSMFCRLLRKVVDPSAIEVATLPRDVSELAQLLNHHWCIFFDNLSVMPDRISDTLCKAVTGDGFAKRELYTNDEDIIFEIKHCVGINGINLVANKPDLLERSILVGLERIPEDKRRSECEIYKEFKLVKPKILGGVLDIVSKAMAEYPSVKLKNLPRMADFAVWGVAIAKAMDYSQEDFINAYYNNIKHQNEEVLAESLIATVVRGYMDSIEGDWEGTPSELHAVLTKHAEEELGIDVAKEREWPKKANVMSRRLNELKTNLETEGLIVDRPRTSGKSRVIILRKVANNIVSTGTIDSTDDCDGDDDVMSHL